MPFVQSFVDSFKAEEKAQGFEPARFQERKENAKLDAGSPNGSGDVEKASVDNVRDLGNENYSNAVGIVVDERGRRMTTAETGLKRQLNGRHMQMIAFGGAIGTGLFIGSGGALESGGPGSLLIDFLIMGVLLACTVLALGEMATTLPVAGSFAAYSSRFIDPAWGFAMGWNYWMQWFVVLPLELVAASIVIDFWDPQAVVPKGVWVAVFIIAISVINFFGVRGYGEFEFVASMIKILAILGFIIVGIVINTGGSPSGTYLGADTWHAPNEAFRNGFKGFCSVFVTAAFAFAGTELIGLAAAESANPRKEVPKATKQVFYRIFFFYIVTLLLVTLIVPGDDERLLGGASSYDARASPFVIAIEIGQIKVLPSIFNAVILISVLSVGNSAVYGGSRTLAGMAQTGLAPKMFAFIDRAGRPTPAVVLSLLFGFLAFLVYTASQNDVFNWLYATCGLSSIFTWGSICLCHIRFRKAWKLQGKVREELPWASPLGVWGSYLGLSLNGIVLIAQFYKAAFPIDEADLTPNERAVNFFQSYLSFPIVVLFYGIGWYVVTGSGWIPISEIDVTTGRREAPTLEVLRAEREEAAAQPLPKRIMAWLF